MTAERNWIQVAKDQTARLSECNTLVLLLDTAFSLSKPKPCLLIVSFTIKDKQELKWAAMYCPHIFWTIRHFSDIACGIDFIADFVFLSSTSSDKAAS